MFRKILLVSAACLAGGAAAHAQDAAPPMSWTGPYVGLHVGGNLDNDAVDTRGINPGNTAALAANARPSHLDLNRNGWLGGAQIGYNYQMGSWVGGVEADIASIDANGSAKYVAGQSSGAVLAGTPTYSSAKLNYLGTARLRAGYLLTPRALLYATGGFAYGNPKYRTSFGSSAGTEAFAGQSRYTAGGWAAGAGMEYALPVSFSMFGSSAVTFRTEYLHYDLGTKLVNDGAVPNVGAGAYVSKFRTKGDTLRAAVNFKF